MLFVHSGKVTSAATCGLSRPTNLLEKSLAKLVRAVTVTVPSGLAPLHTTGVPLGRMPEQGIRSPSRFRTFGLSKIEDIRRENVCETGCCCVGACRFHLKNSAIG